MSLADRGAIVRDRARRGNSRNAARENRIRLRLQSQLCFFGHGNGYGHADGRSPRSHEQPASELESRRRVDQRMQAEDLRRLMGYLQNLVGVSDSRTIVFDIPDERTMLDAGLDAEIVHQLRSAPWLEEMVTDVRETPDFCSPEETSDQMLQYARDVVVEYLRKRFVL